MKVVRVRRVGMSSAVSIPRELERRGIASGTSLLLEGLETGELPIMPTERVRHRIGDVGRRLAGERAGALETLAQRDGDSGRPER